MKNFKVCPICGCVEEIEETICTECGYDFSLSSISPQIISKHNKNVNLEIANIEIIKNEHYPYGILRLCWDSDIGFGQYDLVLGQDSMLHAYTDFMDKEDTKEFTKDILAKLIDSVIIEE